MRCDYLNSPDSPCQRSAKWRVVVRPPGRWAQIRYGCQRHAALWCGDLGTLGLDYDVDSLTPTVEVEP